MNLEERTSNKWLVVEDWKPLRDALEHTFIDLKLSADFAPGQHEALSFARNTLYAKLLIDLHLGMDRGRELYKEIRSLHPRHVHPAVIYMTGKPEQCADLPLEGPLLIKPFRFKELHALVG
ncbi:MAG: response regulator [Verrucomicrobiota bacterium]